MTRVRSTSTRVAELKRWLKKNKTATWQTFVKETGGKESQYYHLRTALGISKRNEALSAAMKEAAKRRLAKKAAQAVVTDLSKIQKDNETFLADKSVPATSTEEVSAPDFMWYELDLMQRRLQDLSQRLTAVMKASRTRDADHKKMMRDLINENSELRVANNDLRQQVAEFTEMINGTPV